MTFDLFLRWPTPGPLALVKINTNLSTFKFRKTHWIIKDCCKCVVSIVEPAFCCLKLGVWSMHCGAWFLLPVTWFAAYSLNNFASSANACNKWHYRAIIWGSNDSEPSLELPLISVHFVEVTSELLGQFRHWIVSKK